MSLTEWESSQKLGVETRQCCRTPSGGSALARLPEPGSSTNITFPPLHLLHFHPGAVLDYPGNASWGEEIEGIFSYSLNWFAEFIEFAGFSSF